MLFKKLFALKSHSLLKKSLTSFRCFSFGFTGLPEGSFSNYATTNKRSTLKQIGYLYIIDPDSANFIASAIAENWNQGYILEANPGPGVLSSSLLKYGIQSLRVFEKNIEYLPALQVLSATYPNLEIVQEDLMFLPGFDSRMPCTEQSHWDTFFQGIPELHWNDVYPWVITGHCSTHHDGISGCYIENDELMLKMMEYSDHSFLYNVVINCINQMMYMTAVEKENFSMYRWTTVLYNLFFEIKCLKKFSYESLFSEKGAYYHKKGKNASNTFYFVQLTPKTDIFSNQVKDNNLPDLYFFVRHHLVKRKALVIPTLEGWVPFCGPRLIKEGMNVFTRFGDLSPHQILLLFNQFSSWPEYQDCAFKTAASRFFGKQQFAYEEDDLKEL